ncbi:MAG: aldo/keto reductase [Haloarculaceae archaeon]
MTELPPIGIGTWQNTDPEECTESVRTALEMGYRHVDTAEMYGNEDAVGEGIAAADVDREDVFLATKAHSQGTGLTYDAVHETAEGSLDRLGVEYLDMLYVHWPLGEYEPAETLPAYDELVEAGTIRNVGVSNFEPFQVERAMEVLDAPAFANQVEMHPLLQQEELVAHAQEHDYYLVAYSPLARGDVFDVPEVVEVAEKHGVSPAQVSLAWLTSKDNVVAIPKATSRDHIADNWAARDLALDAEDVAKIEGIEREHRHLDPDGAAWNR